MKVRALTCCSVIVIVLIYFAKGFIAAGLVCLKLSNKSLPAGTRDMKSPEFVFAVASGREREKTGKSTRGKRRRPEVKCCF